MRYLTLTLIVMMGLPVFVQAQVNPHAIGLRLGAANTGNGGEISYQHGFGDKNRLELDLGWRNSFRNNYSRLGISGIYHWVFNVDGGFNWFVGPGAQIGVFDDRDDPDQGGISLGIGGQIGIEYDFNTHDVPIQLSFDVRPMFDFWGYFDGFGYGSALGVRYTF